MKVSPAGWAAGGPEQAGGTRQLASEGFGDRTISSLTSFPLVSLCVGGRNEREQGGRKAFKEDSGENKAQTRSPWISDCLSREVSLCTLLGFREKRTEAGTGAGAWKEGAEGPGPRSQHLGARAKDKCLGGQGCGLQIEP